ncbi:lasso peptide biosynthesis B2 protein [Paenibacillus sp. YYML68]|uniref:lasso peptide biosynthesis B2 protein n=1 Tax=Paenibacillus sp. YYML68 TaxID=2909250 RepID=UPI002492ED5C|nr:lasso peptide biosynthesis B2 protein [Paenibacillus sp. YYML68]
MMKMLDQGMSFARRWSRRIERASRLPWKAKALVLISYVLMGLVRLCILVIPFKYMAPCLGRKNGSTSLEVPKPMLARAARIGWIVETTSRFTPWESKCLVRAITAQLLLRLVRTPSTLYLGMAKDQSEKLIAHAWLRCGEHILTGASEADNFVKVAQFASLLHRETAVIIDRR